MLRISMEMGNQAKIIGCQTEWFRKVNLPGPESLHCLGDFGEEIYLPVKTHWKTHWSVHLANTLWGEK